MVGEADVPFFSIVGLTSLNYLSMSAHPSHVHDLFKEARVNAPCIIFISMPMPSVANVVAVAFQVAMHNERENALLQLLVEMDGFSAKMRAVVLAGAHLVDILDHALTRPGRFDRNIAIIRCLSLVRTHQLNWYNGLYVTRRSLCTRPEQATLFGDRLCQRKATKSIFAADVTLLPVTQYLEQSFLHAGVGSRSKMCNKLAK